MQTANRRRTSWAILASVVAHVALTVVVVLQRPLLKIPVEDAGPPQAIIPILLMPRVPPSEVRTGERPGEIRLHRRRQRFVLTDTPPPVVLPAQPAPAPPAPASATPHPAPQPEGPNAEVRTALRQGLFGCANIAAAKLTRAERDLCDERLGRGARDTPFLDPALGLSREKRAVLDQAVAGRDALARDRDRNVPPGLTAGINDSSQPSKSRSLEEPPPPRLPP